MLNGRIYGQKQGRRCIIYIMKRREDMKKINRIVEKGLYSYCRYGNIIVGHGFMVHMFLEK